MISVEVEGIEEAQAMLKTLETYGNTINAAEVLGHKRESDTGASRDINNAEILEWLADDGRNFYELDDAEMAKIDRKFVAMLSKGLERWTHLTTKGTQRSMMRTLGRGLKSGNLGGALLDQAAKAARQIMGSSLRATCKLYLKIISENVENGRWLGHRGDLTKEYADYKQKKYGFTHPIGVASGQLRANIAPLSRNIKLRTKDYNPLDDEDIV